MNSCGRRVEVRSKVLMFFCCCLQLLPLYLCWLFSFIGCNAHLQFPSLHAPERGSHVTKRNISYSFLLSLSLKWSNGRLLTSAGKEIFKSRLGFYLSARGLHHLAHAISTSVCQRAYIIRVLDDSCDLFPATMTKGKNKNNNEI